MTWRPFILLVALLTPCLLQAQREKLPPEDLAWVEENFPDARKSSTGIRFLGLEVGTGETIRQGDLASVLYTGRLTTGETFDQQIDPEKPLQFRVGRGQVIQGWDQIIKLMRVGDKWIVIIPPELAYGTRGSPPRIPRNATLIFTIQVVGVERGS